MAKKLAKAQYGRGVEKYKTPADTRSTNERVGITPPTGNNSLNTPPTGKNPLNSGVYRGTKLTPAQIKQSQEDWKKKEREMTNPKNRAKGSALTPLKRGGMIKKKK
jgi:hypothetical protein